jgi:hypothetical protein
VPFLAVVSSLYPYFCSCMTCSISCLALSLYHYTKTGQKVLTGYRLNDSIPFFSFPHVTSSICLERFMLYFSRIPVPPTKPLVCVEDERYLGLHDGVPS